MRSVGLECGLVVPIVVLLSGCSSGTSHSSAGGGTGGAPDASAADTPLESFGCRLVDSAPVYGPGTTAAQISFAGADRTFRVHVPQGYQGTSATPLVLMFHGGGGSGRQFEEASSRMDPISDREGFIAVYPDGTGPIQTWNGGGCCGSAVRNDVDDVGFVAALLDHLESSLCVDRRRLFASGMSNGGIFSHRLGCELADRLAAIAPVAGTNNAPACDPVRPLPVMHTHGTMDGHVPWDGGEGCGPAGVPFVSVPATIDGWRTRNGCSAETTPYFSQGEGQCERYTGCTDSADVVLCSIEGGGHNWPGGDPPADLTPCPGNGVQSHTFLASEAIWRFFATHPFRGTP